jgi:hypothetical protein
MECVIRSGLQQPRPHPPVLSAQCDELAGGSSLALDFRASAALSWHHNTFLTKMGFHAWFFSFLAYNPIATPQSGVAALRCLFPRQI